MHNIILWWPKTSVLVITFVWPPVQPIGSISWNGSQTFKKESRWNLELNESRANLCRLSLSFWDDFLKNLATSRYHDCFYQNQWKKKLHDAICVMVTCFRPNPSSIIASSTWLYLTVTSDNIDQIAISNTLEFNNLYT